MNKKEKIDSLDNDIGYILWELESYENFFPCLKSMMKKEK